MLLCEDPGTDQPQTPIAIARIELWTRDLHCRKQTLKERFAEILPEKVEEIKALRKLVASYPPLPSSADDTLLTSF